MVYYDFAYIFSSPQTLITISFKASGESTAPLLADIQSFVVELELVSIFQGALGSFLPVKVSGKMSKLKLG
jgi:hypothetical protein